MKCPNKQFRSPGSDAAMSTDSNGGTDSPINSRTVLTVYQAQERQFAIQK